MAQKNKQKLVWRQQEQIRLYWLNRILRLADSSICWDGLPGTVDTVYLESVLNETGSAIIVKDDIMGFMAGQNASTGMLDYDAIPEDRRIIFRNGIGASYSKDDSVIVYNNEMRCSDVYYFNMFANEMAEIDMAIRVNMNTQKTMPLIPAKTTTALSLENIMSAIHNNMPYLLIDPDSIPFEMVKNSMVFDNRKSFTSDLMMQVQREKWNRILTFIGINNPNIEKRERVNVQETISNDEELFVMRRSRLNARERACEKLNEKFGLNVTVMYYADKRRVENGIIYDTSPHDIDERMDGRPSGRDVPGE